MVDVGVYDRTRAAVQLDADCWLLDLGFQGRSGVVAAYLFASNGGALTLVETGPSSTLDNLVFAIRQAGFDPARLEQIIVTHIHLDHAGAAGPLARDNPELIVHVHPFGASHMIDPSKLVSSASRIYGEQMEPLWGEVAAIRAEQIRPMAEGQRIGTGEREFEVLFTPGHASHHIVLWDEANGVAVTGDTAGVRMQGTGYNCSPTPPPDLDPATWAATTERLRDLGARRWLLTHFGAFDDAAAHIDQLTPNLEVIVDLGMSALDSGATHEELTALIHDHMESRLGPQPEGVLTNLEWSTPSYMAALGLMRLHKQRRQAEAS